MLYWHELVIPGVFTLIGAFLGAWLAGKKTIESVKEQIDYDRIKEQAIRKDRHARDVLIIERYLKDLLTYMNQLSFFLMKNEAQEVETDSLVEEIRDLHKEILLVEANIDRIETEYMELNIVNEIQHLLTMMTRIDLSLNAYYKGIFIQNRKVSVEGIFRIIKESEKRGTLILKHIKQ